MAEDRGPGYVVTGKVRLSFPHLFEPYAYDPDKAKTYSVMILIPKTDTVTTAAIRAAQQAAFKAKFPGKKITRPDTLRDGDAEKDTDEYPEYAGHWFMNVSAPLTNRPNVVDSQLRPVLDATEVYSGCYARVSIAAFAYENKGHGVSFGLRNVQKLADGEPLSGGSSKPEDDFEAVDEDDLL